MAILADMVQDVNSSDAERFERAYRTLWGALSRRDDPDLSQHERQLLHHVPPEEGVPLTWLAQHLALPKSTASVLVKDLASRGFLMKTRAAHDERRLAIALTPRGRRRVERDTVLEPERLSRALADLPDATRRSLLTGMEALVEASGRRAREDASASA
jgi:DNA-binding MarR family transcriptional regulator